MEKVTGIGGVFFRARQPEALARWYFERLGIDTVGDAGAWWQEAGPTVFAPFESETDYFGRRDQQWMLNFRVSDLDAVLAALRSAAVPVDDEVQVMDGIGRFGWATDPEGNRFELWEPAPETLRPREPA
ncbi:MAG TPA: VOC family protein [Candidatus Limnocylindria bacterium]|jgi:catechol 2,3-dioxygenase-like lactoylglutathione lyase family enzyme|nr:VOC family protein [Candidatus Limnocylindria bacterium]